MDTKNKWKGYPSDPLKGCASDLKKKRCASEPPKGWASDPSKFLVGWQFSTKFQPLEGIKVYFKRVKFDLIFIHIHVMILFIYLLSIYV